MFLIMIGQNFWVGFSFLSLALSQALLLRHPLCGVLARPARFPCTLLVLTKLRSPWPLGSTSVYDVPLTGVLCRERERGAAKQCVNE